MVDWVHCNQCFCKPGKQHRFFLTSCGHIFCEDCLKEAGSSDHCRICRISCSIIQLTAKMKPDVEIFFMDPLDIVKKQQKELIEQQKKLLQVIDFQKNHRQRLAAHQKEQDAKLMSQVQIAKQQMDRVVHLERELLCLKEENLRLKCRLSGSPGPGPGGAATPSYSRPGTPGRVLSSSAIPLNMRNMVHQNSSQSVSRSSSPYSRSQHMDASKIQQSPMTPSRKTPPGPARFSIRTPPINGRIGTVSTPGVGHMTRTPSGTLIRSANTPGTGPGRTSPMNISPASARRCFPSFDGRSTPHSDTSSQGSLTPGLSHSSTSDGNRKQTIQLNYTPKRPMLSGVPGSQPRSYKSLPS